MSGLSRHPDPDAAPSPRPLCAAPRAPRRPSPEEAAPRPHGHGPSDAPSIGRCTPVSLSSSSSPRSAAPFPLSSAIDLLILDLTTEFHDDGHVASNRTQAARLWRASLLDEGAFMEVMYSARAIARSRGTIEKRATSGPAHLRNRMPYFFAVLRNELRRIGRLSASPETLGPAPAPAPAPDSAAEGRAR